MVRKRLLQENSKRVVGDTVSHATDIVGYTFNADLYCVECIGDTVAAHVGLHKDWARALRHTGRVRDVERWLDHVAQRYGVNRHDETTFDSDEFPKVVFRDMLATNPFHEPDCESCPDGRDRCGSCGKVLGQ